MIIALSSIKIERSPHASVANTVLVVIFFCRLMNVLSLEVDWMRDAQVPILPFRDPSEPRVKEPVVTCDTSCCNSVFVRFRTAPRIHLFDAGNVSEMMLTGVLQLLVGG